MSWRVAKSERCGAEHVRPQILIPLLFSILINATALVPQRARAVAVPVAALPGTAVFAPALGGARRVGAWDCRTRFGQLQEGAKYPKSGASRGGKLFPIPFCLYGADGCECTDDDSLVDLLVPFQMVYGVEWLTVESLCERQKWVNCIGWVSLFLLC
jgi:hypothetical protein